MREANVNPAQWCQSQSRGASALSIRGTLSTLCCRRMPQSEGGLGKREREGRRVTRCEGFKASVSPCDSTVTSHASFHQPLSF